MLASVRAQLWDTAGNTKYRAMTSAYYHGAVAALFLFDITDRASFDNVAAWCAPSIVPWRRAVV